MIAGYCARSTECSDHSLKKYGKVFFNLLSFFFRRGVMKGVETKNWRLRLFDSHSKISKLKNYFYRTIT